jgi:hypothetical protein
LGELRPGELRLGDIFQHALQNRKHSLGLNPG